ncbi:putative phage baseplate assembly protein [Kribbella sp. VKM Ac-2569]|uniref:putative baseplate assembly protein n=1 Tax=Kribbella sp. VKM Ac-2569 TaxID=2512220 RepID=UPI00102D1EAB|nr:putative baseplate assembly protein [Kribbella sp. VKM Ac-2569]RZT17533.1 putative phage baseplate assembly protein [Kribbella sp. VKM Ac-2569]
MALISPILDNRTYQELRDELVRLIPVHSRTWTNHNEGDAGITLIELFASLGESLLYRFNQIPDTTRVEFLRLLGVQPRPARPAHVLLSASTDEPAGIQVLRDSEAMAGALPFQTEDEVYVWPVDALGAGKFLTVGGGADIRADALERVGLPASGAAFYRTVLTPKDPMAADAVPIDVSAQLDRSLWVALMAPPTIAVSVMARRTLFLGIAFDEELDPPPLIEKLTPDETEVFRSGALIGDPPATLWQLWTGPTAVGVTPFVTLPVLGDTTHGMVTTGVVKLELPAHVGRLAELGDGLTNSPPPVDDEEVREQIFAWLRVTRPDRPNIGDAIHKVRWVGANCVSAVQSRTPPPELLGSGTGDADQRFPLTHAPVLADTVQLQVEEADGWTDWEEVDNFARSTVDDRHFVVAHDGAVAFGAARVPQIGERIRVLSYRYGGGKAGNLAPGSVSAFPAAPSVTVTNPLPAVGGADAVNLAEALDAIPGEVHRRDRAVVAEDYRALALEVTGVSRAEVLPLFHPDTPAVKAAGVTSVVVLPDSDQRNPDAPMPDLGLLRRVARYLDVRRPVTSELYVIPPEYVRVAVSVGVQVREGYQVDAVRRWVEQILQQFLSAVPPGGPDAAGWPLGRAIRAAELEAVAVQVEGVEFAVGTRLATVDPSVTEREAALLQPWQLPELTTVTVVSGDPTEPGIPIGAPPPELVPVPLPPEVC